jgi:hypothetical protein
VYFVMAMCLYPRVAYEEVFRLVIEGLRRIYGDQVRDAQVSKAAISQGRARLGWQVMRELFARQAAQRPRTAGDDYAGYRVMSVDGSRWMCLMRRSMRRRSVMRGAGAVRPRIRRFAL